MEEKPRRKRQHHLLYYLRLLLHGYNFMACFEPFWPWRWPYYYKDIEGWQIGIGPFNVIYASWLTGEWEEETKNG